MGRPVSGVSDGCVFVVDDWQYRRDVFLCIAIWGLLWLIFIMIVISAPVGMMCVCVCADV